MPEVGATTGRMQAPAWGSRFYGYIGGIQGYIGDIYWDNGKENGNYNLGFGV